MQHLNNTDTHNLHTISTQYAHTQNTDTTIQQQIYMQHKKDTEQHTEQDNAQPQHRLDTDNLYTYSFDLYHEYVCIKNSNTIELYTISKENI